MQNERRAEDRHARAPTPSTSDQHQPVDKINKAKLHYTAQNDQAMMEKRGIDRSIHPSRFGNWHGKKRYAMVGWLAVDASLARVVRLAMITGSLKSETMAMIITA